jgi:hypothetical protein
MFRVLTTILPANYITNLVKPVRTVKVRTSHETSSFTTMQQKRNKLWHQTLLPTYIIRDFVNNKALDLQFFDHWNKCKRHITQFHTRKSDSTKIFFTWRQWIMGRSQHLHRTYYHLYSSTNWQCTHAVTTDKSSLVHRRQGVRDKSSTRETQINTLWSVFNGARGDTRVRACGSGYTAIEGRATRFRMQVVSQGYVWFVQGSDVNFAGLWQLHSDNSKPLRSSNGRLSSIKCDCVDRRPVKKVL